MLKPTYARFDYEGDHWVWGVDEAQQGKVAAGYACGRCLEEFNTYLPVCPVCKEPTPQAKIVPLPQGWEKQGA